MFWSLSSFFGGSWNVCVSLRVTLQVPQVHLYRNVTTTATSSLFKRVVFSDDGDETIEEGDGTVPLSRMRRTQSCPGVLVP